MACLLSAALVAGFAGFAAFMSLRTIVAAVVFGALYLFLEATKAFFAAPDEQNGAPPRACRPSRCDHGRPRAHGARCSPASCGCCWWRSPASSSSAHGRFPPPICSTPSATCRSASRSTSCIFRCGALVGAPRALGGLILITRGSPALAGDASFCRARAIEPSLQHSIATIFGYVGVDRRDRAGARRVSASTCRRSRWSPARCRSASASACNRSSRTSSPA